MSNSTLKLEKTFEKSEIEGKDTREKVENTKTEELFFSICSPIGSLKESVISELMTQLQNNYNYDVELIKLSDFINKHKLDDYQPLTGKTEIYSQYHFKINQGNKLREKYNKQFLAELSIAQIYTDRASEFPEQHLDNTIHKSRRKCYIFDSTKNKEELQLLRAVYTDNFFQISIFSPLPERIENLIKKGFAEPEAEELINIDDYQNSDVGQNVRNTFVEGDFFLRNSKDNIIPISDRIERYLHLIFESKVVTPTIEETSMFYAKSAANNSSCLSRQVGACIIDEKGNILSTGWNDVPKFGGNLYRDGSLLDDRCFVNGYCSNDRHKDELSENIINTLLEEPDLKKLFSVDNEENKYDIQKIRKFKKIIRNSKVKDLIEFSRSVHAEMHAIILGSQISGNQMVNGKLFCTTYPCHNCARHIILAGIKEVYFIEPYVKSLGLRLHSDSLTESELDDQKVKVLMYDGVAPRKYQIFFTNFEDRKTKLGELKTKVFFNLKPKVAKSLQALPELERQAIHSLKKYGLILIDGTDGK